MKALAIVAVILSLAGCGKVDRSIASLTGFARSCVDGVLYYQFTSGVTVAYSPDGKVRTCQ